MRDPRHCRARIRQLRSQTARVDANYNTEGKSWTPSNDASAQRRRAALAGLLTAAVLLLIDSAAADVALRPMSRSRRSRSASACRPVSTTATGLHLQSRHDQPGDSSVEGFALDSIRLYINGGVTDQIKLTFNTEYTGSGRRNKVEVLDAIGRFEFSDKFNIWAGRFLPPSDRANLYGPYYANDWAPYADGVADFYPNVAVGRDNGVAYWGQFGMLKVQVGAFDGESLQQRGGRQEQAAVRRPRDVGFLGPEKGYYFNGTYYGDKDMLALGVAAQNQDSKTTYTRRPDGEEARRPRRGDASRRNTRRTTASRPPTPSDGWYGLASYLFPQVDRHRQVPGARQVQRQDHRRHGDARLAVKLKTDEVNLNYIIKEFNARVGFYYLQLRHGRPRRTTPSDRQRDSA